jgi:hypothetical protein
VREVEGRGHRRIVERGEYGRERSRLRAMPTSQNRDVGHPVQRRHAKMCATRQGRHRIA